MSLSLMDVSSDSEDEPMFTADEREGRRVLEQLFIEQCTLLRQLQETREARAMMGDRESDDEEEDDDEEERFNRLPIDSEMVRRQTEAELHRQAVEEALAWRVIDNAVIQAAEVSADLAVAMESMIVSSRIPDLPEASDPDNDNENDQP